MAMSLRSPTTQVAGVHIGHTHPLRAVLGWELQRLVASRAFWITTLLVFAASFALEWLVGSAESVTIASAAGPRTFLWSFTNNWGLYNTLPETPGLFLGMFLPFLNVDGVARDLHRRTHELLMTTAIPSWAYVWGRYLSGLLVSLGMACIVLAVIFLSATVRHLAQSDIYLAPDVPGFTAQWALIVLPPTVLLSSVSFALGTLLPRLATVLKLVIMLGWFVGGQMIRWAAIAGLTAGYAVWDPTSEAIAYAQTAQQFLDELARQTYKMNHYDFLVRLHLLEGQLPAMRSWILPHVVWALIGLALVALATPMFRRFRTMLS